MPLRKESKKSDVQARSGRNKFTGVRVRGQGLFRTDIIETTGNAVCKVESNEEQATGFLGVLRAENAELYGLFTNHHVFGINDLSSDGFDIKCTFYKKNTWVLEPGPDNFCFCCPVLDVSFVSLTREQTQTAKRLGFNILSLMIDASNVGAYCEQAIFVAHYPGFGEQCLSNGKIHSSWGCDFYHTASTRAGSSGAPVVNEKGMVIGIHKGTKETKDLNIAVQIRYVIEAVLKDYCRGCTRMLREPVSFMSHPSLEQELKDKGLTRVCDANSVLFKKQGQNMWFQRTAHFWYCTCTDPTETGRSWPEWRRVSPELFLNDMTLNDAAIIHFLLDSGDYFL